MDLEIIRYCAEECERQGSGELSVYNMCNAWDYAQAVKKSKALPNLQVDLNLIEHLGVLVEPKKNKNGFRTIPIYVGNGFELIETAPWERVPDLLTLLLLSYYGNDLVPFHPESKTVEDEFYYEYENIHPFVDGNGRTGKIIYNYLKRTLDKPIMPPNFFGISNP